MICFLPLLGWFYIHTIYIFINFTVQAQKGYSAPLAQAFFAIFSIKL